MLRSGETSHPSARIVELEARVRDLERTIQRERSNAEAAQRRAQALELDLRAVSRMLVWR